MGPGDDSVTGGSGPDTLNGGANSDTINGGPGGFDEVNYSGRSGSVNVNLGTTGVFDDGSDVDDAVSGAIPRPRDRISGGIDAVLGGSGNDRITATSVTSAVRLEGRGGNDDITGGPSNDTILGGDEDDDLDGFEGSDNIEGGNGNDVLRGGRGDFADTINGQGGTDTVSYSDRGGRVEVSLGNGSNDDGPLGENDALVAIEAAVGTPFDDLLTTNLAGGSSLTGLDGNDTLTGGGGPDSLDGGNGTDLLRGFDGDDRLDGGNDNDDMNGMAGSDTALGGEGDDNIQAVDGVFDDVDCGGGGSDTGVTDGGDRRVNCELPAAPGGGGGGTGGTGGGTGGGGTTPPTPLRVMAVSVGYSYFPDPPKKTTKFKFFTAKNLPKNAKVVARCVTKKGKKCKGKLGKTFTKKKTKRKQLKIPIFNRKFPAGVQLEVTVTKSGFKTQVKIVQVRKNKIPNILTRCISPPSKKRTSC